MWPRPRWRLQTSLAAVAILAVALGGFSQIEKARREERLQRLAMMKALPLRRLKKIFSPPGVAILRQARDVEVFRVHGSGRLPNVFPRGSDLDDLPMSRVSPVSGQELASALSRSLLDGSRYYFVAGDPTPRARFRFRRGAESLDVLVGLGGTPRVEVVAFVRDDRGRLIHEGSWANLDHPSLYRLVEESLGESSAGEE